MATPTETMYVRGTTSARMLAALETIMNEAGFELHGTRLSGKAKPAPEGARGIVLLRRGRWFAVASDRRKELEAWGRALSEQLARSVLTVVADGESAVLAHRWRDGESRAKVKFVDDSPRGGLSKLLGPWLGAERRTATLPDATTAALLGAIGAPEEEPWAARGALVLVFTPSAKSRKSGR